jgi:hypothetical protein
MFGGRGETGNGKRETATTKLHSTKKGDSHMERKAIRTFEDLLVWQKAIEFVKEVYLVTNEVI